MGSRSSSWSGGPLCLEPIGVVHSPFVERREAPRQPSLAREVEGTVELLPGRDLEDAVSDLERWSYIWLIVWFDRNEAGFRPKVAPPRGDKKRGVLATRAPYRPNPIGLSAVQLLAVAGRELRIRGLDLLDGTPVLDIKPYVPYTDAIVDANSGWLDAEADPEVRYTVGFSPESERQLAFLESHGIPLQQALVQTLSLGPSPHAYRRIRKLDHGYRLAHKDWRVFFQVEGPERIVVTHLASGYRPAELWGDPPKAPELHRLFSARFRT